MKRSFLICAFAFALVACGGDGDPGDTGDCVDLCSEAQAGNCTSITGSCSGFCSALDNVQGPSGCTDERDSYQGCLESNADVCASDCSAQEGTLSNCLGVYCLAHQADPDCQTLAGSF